MVYRLGAARRGFDVLRSRLPRAERVLVVCAHPDDESFGLGAVLSTLVDAGSEIEVMCFTHGEASSLGSRTDLAAIRAQELDAASQVLGISRTHLLDYPDGSLAAVPIDRLVDDITSKTSKADLVIVFDRDGITGHPDHRQATRAGIAWARSTRVGILEWVISADVAKALNSELATAFVGRSSNEVDFKIVVDRGNQIEAIGCHASQSNDNPVLWRRLALQGDREYLRFTDPVSDGSPGPVASNSAKKPSDGTNIAG